VERHGAEGVGHQLLVPAYVEPGVPSWGRGGLLVQRLLLLRLWPGQEAGRRIEARCGHEGMPQVVVGWPRCVGPTVGTSGGGGLARRATTASAADVILAVVAATITTIAVFVVVVSDIGRARRCERRWLSHRGRNVGVECHRGRRRPGTVHVNLLH
jgi:hypothetical protein